MLASSPPDTVSRPPVVRLAPSVYVPLIVRAAKLLVFDSVIPVPDRVIVPPLAVKVPAVRENEPPTDIVPVVIENVPFVWLNAPVTVVALVDTVNVPPDSVSTPVTPVVFARALYVPLIVSPALAVTL